MQKQEKERIKLLKKNKQSITAYQASKTTKEAQMMQKQA